jgi:hypothetical protein
MVVFMDKSSLFNVGTARITGKTYWILQSGSEEEML